MEYLPRGTLYIARESNIGKVTVFATRSKLNYHTVVPGTWALHSTTNAMPVGHQRFCVLHRKVMQTGPYSRCFASPAAHPLPLFRNKRSRPLPCATSRFSGHWMDFESSSYLRLEYTLGIGKYLSSPEAAEAVLNSYLTTLHPWRLRLTLVIPLSVHQGFGA